MRRLARVLAIGWVTVSLAQTPTPTGNEHMEYWIKTVQTHPMDLVRKNAARALGAMGDRTATPALIQALNDKFFGVRAEAANSLGLLTDERAVDPLTETATNDSDTQVRRNAREALERLKGYQEYLKKKQEKADKAAEKAEAAKKGM
ncbi:MAG: HEAT repeat domain-containing protein [Pseudomonadota bacterium]